MKRYAALRRGGLTLKSAGTSVADPEIRTAALPSIAVFPLLQHSGSPARALVSVGERVREGMLIAEGAGEISAAVHSSIPGVVIARRGIRLSNGQRSEAIVVKLEGAFERLGRSPLSAAGDDELHRHELLARLEEQGVVSLDEAALPLHLHWRVPRGKRVEKLFVSAVDPEPLIFVESLLADKRIDALAEGLTVAARILEPRSIVFVSEEGQNEGSTARQRLSRLKESVASIGIALSEVKIGAHYPRGNGHDLLRAAEGRRIGRQQPLSDLGLAVTNVSTLIAVRDAVLGGKPLIERCVTVAGSAVRKPATLRVRIGTRIRDLIEECGGLRETPERIVLGGPLTGSTVYDLDTPIMKASSALLVLSKDEVGAGEQTACINCGRCLSVCPERLNPIVLLKEIDHGTLERADSMGLLDCSECGSCAFACPSHIPLLEGLRRGRQALWRLEVES